MLNRTVKACAWDVLREATVGGELVRTVDEQRLDQVMGGVDNKDYRHRDDDWCDRCHCRRSHCHCHH
jgi:hypothetical protein